MRIRRIVSRVILHGVLIAGSALFMIPFFWLLSTSLKAEDEMFLEPPRWIPQIPAASPISPYVETREFPAVSRPEYVEDEEKWEELKPDIVTELTDLVRPFAAKPPDPVKEDRLRGEMVEGLWARLSARLPEDSWKKSPKSIATELVSYADAEMFRSVYESCVRKLMLGEVRFHTWSAEKEIPYGWEETASNWESLTDAASVVPASDLFRHAARVDYDLRKAKQFTIRAELPCGLELDDFKKIVLGHRTDRNWFRMDCAVEFEGRRFESVDAHFLSGDNWQEVAWQFPNNREKIVERKTWRSLEEVAPSPESVYFNEPGRIRIDLTVHRTSPLGAYWHKCEFNYIAAVNLMPLLLYTRNSVLLVILNVVGAVIGCSLCAYAFGRLKWPGRDFCFILLLATLMIPPQVTMIPVFLIFTKLGWYNTLFPLWVPSFFGAAFFIFLLRQFMKSIPTDLEDSAKIDGCGYLRTFTDIILPLLKPALAAVAIFTFMGVWNDFMGPLIFVTDQRLYPLSLGLFAIKVIAGGNMGVMMASSLVMTLPVIIIFFLAQRHFIQGITLTGMKG